MKKSWTTTEQHYLKCLYKEGQTAGQISHTLSRSINSINKALSRYNLRNKIIKRPNRRLKKVCYRVETFIPFRMADPVAPFTAPAISYRALFPHTMPAFQNIWKQLEKILVHAKTMRNDTSNVITFNPPPITPPLPVTWLQRLGEYEIQPMIKPGHAPNLLYEVSYKARDVPPVMLNQYGMLSLINKHRQKLGLPPFQNHDMIIKEEAKRH